MSSNEDEVESTSCYVVMCREFPIGSEADECNSTRIVGVYAYHERAVLIAKDLKARDPALMPFIEPAVMYFQKD